MAPSPWALLGFLCAAWLQFAPAVFAAQDFNFDRYGGYKKIAADATGFFRLERIEDRHFLITPEGHGYRALGINHFHTMTSRDYDAVIGQIRSWSFNAGCYQGPKWMWNRYPYTQGITLVDTSSFYSEDRFSFQDVFSQEYASQTEARIKRIVEPQANNKMLIGYFWTDIPVWTREKNGMTWISYFQSLPRDAPGKKVWDEWKSANPDKSERGFVGVVARQVYALGHEILRRYDQNHLIFGDRYWVDDMPDFVINEALPYIDGIAVQPPGRRFNRAFFDDLYARYKLPIYIADHVTSYATEDYPRTMGQIANDAGTYVTLYDQYLSEAFSKPYIVGFNKCQYQDTIAQGLLKQGLIDERGEPYPTTAGIRDANRKALEALYGAFDEGK